MCTCFEQKSFKKIKLIKLKKKLRCCVKMCMFSDTKDEKFQKISEKMRGTKSKHNTH